MSSESDAAMAARLAREEADAALAREMAGMKPPSATPTPKPKDEDTTGDEELARRLQAELDGGGSGSGSGSGSATSAAAAGGGAAGGSSSSDSNSEPVKISEEQIIAVAEKVMEMTGDATTKRLAEQEGLAVNSVSWEDMGRWRGSKFGPAITDMTLQYGLYRMPVVRHPNFTDLSWDVPLEKVQLMVGNETGDGSSGLYSITLREYLQNIKLYLSNPESWPVDTPAHDGRVDTSAGLYAAKRDSHAVVSAQGCFLPVPRGAETEFRIAAFNPRSRPGRPAVLAIVATAQGTSAQIVDSMDEFDGQMLFFNKGGRRCPLVAQRLSDNRRERGVRVEGDMTREEKSKNMVMVIQVPLQIRREHRPPRPPRGRFQPYFCLDGGPGGARTFKPYRARARKLSSTGRSGGGAGGGGFGGGAPAAASASMSRPAPGFMPPPGPEDPFWSSDDDDGDFEEEDAFLDEVYQQRESAAETDGLHRAAKADVEDAIIKVGDDTGAFREFGGCPVRRDADFPIRVTMCFYKSTETGVATPGDMAYISQQIKEAQRNADYIGSLVVGGKVGRPTEPSPGAGRHDDPPRPSPVDFVIPSWWSNFWLTYGSSDGLRHWDERDAQRRVFGPGGSPNLAYAALDNDVRQQILRMLSGTFHDPVRPPRPHPHPRPRPPPHHIHHPDPYYTSSSDSEDDIARPDICVAR